MNALDDLRLKAQKMVERDDSAERTKRPTFAPAIYPLGDELVQLLHKDEMLSPVGQPLARLWARFTSPCRGSVECDGFDLIAGTKHDKKRRMWRAHHFDKEKVLANLQRQMEMTTHSSTLSFLDDALRTTQSKTGGWTFYPGPGWWGGNRSRIAELSQQRVMVFLGAIDEEMRAAGRYWGHCCVCGKALTVPESIEYGVGPECRRRYDVTIRQAPGQWIIGGSDAADAAEVGGAR